VATDGSGASDQVQSMKQKDEFIPNYDQNVLKSGSIANQHYLSQKKRQQHAKKIKRYTDHCIKLIEENAHRELASYLNQINEGSNEFAGDLDMSNGQIDLPDKIRINDLIDADGFSLLHMAVFKNKQKCFDVLLKHANKQLENQEVTAWTNLQTHKDKFAAIHYGSFRGNVDVCEQLINNGANVKVTNQYGLNVMHIAAQGD
jgi:ankyrin repeat protein